MKLRFLIAGLACLGLTFSAFAATQPQEAWNKADSTYSNAKNTVDTGKNWARRAKHSKNMAKSDITTSTKQVNINNADVKTLATLKGIGKTRAQAIVKYRKQHGDFKSVVDLAKVKGISEKVVKRNSDNLTVG